MVSGIIQALIALNDESYVPQRWHATLITIAIIAAAIIFNTFLAVKLPLIEGILLGLHICGVFAIVIPLWVMGSRAPAETALLTYVNQGGWDSMGLAALIGMVTPLNVLIGYDCSVHMCKSITSNTYRRFRSAPNKPSSRGNLGLQPRSSTRDHVERRAERSPRPSSDHHPSLHFRRPRARPLDAHRRTFHPNILRRDR